MKTDNSLYLFYVEQSLLHWVQFIGFNS